MNHSELAVNRMALRDRYRDDPQAARYTYRVRAHPGADSDPRLVEAQSLTHSGGSWKVSVNERIGGEGVEPTPGDLILAALAACRALSIRMVADSLGVVILDLDVEASGEVDHRGVLLMPGAERLGLQSVQCKVRLTVEANTPKEAVQQLLHVSEQVCAASDTIGNATPIETTYELRA